jgi:hypothetical protein
MNDFEKLDIVLLAGRQGDTRIWYTGRSGPAFVSQNRDEAFNGLNREGAWRVARKLNVMTPLHGVTFEPEVSERKEA